MTNTHGCHYVSSKQPKRAPKEIETAIKIPDLVLLNLANRRVWRTALPHNNQLNVCSWVTSLLNSVYKKEKKKEDATILLNL